MTDCCLGDSKTSFEYIFFLILQLWTHFLTLDEWAEEEAEAAKKRHLGLCRITIFYNSFLRKDSMCCWYTDELANGFAADA